ncbi:hypothetical protein XENOCAPTIV_009901 [Xenoophorus captivus]|uniref:SET domain-containing protein n=1 Tax=Xenoophorus captivus TaxID=1517983 RepID=A0ABV0R0U5_9TELE
MTSATILNYIKNMIRFIQFLKLELSLKDSASIYLPKCQAYMDLLSTLRKPVSKQHSQAVCKTRYDRYVEGQRSLHECHKVMRVCKKDMFGLFAKLLEHKQISREEKTLFRYYCEAIILLKHYQRPGVVEGFTVSEWMKRKSHDGKMVIGVSQHKTANMQIATFALNTEQAAMLDAYYHYIRPEFVKESGEEEEHFFIGSHGRPITCASQDLSRLHAHYKLPNVTTQEIRRVAETLGGQMCTEEQKTTVAHYLAHSNVVAEGKYRSRTLEEAVLASNLIGGFENSSEDSGGEISSQEEKRQRDEEDDKEDLSKFLKYFPVTLDGQPPSKKQRVQAGFSEGRVFYDKWRVLQYAKREEHLLSKYTRNPPTIQRVRKDISKDGWKANHPSPEDIVAKWQPPKRKTVERDPKILNNIQKQKWSGLTIKDFGGTKGEGVVATKPFLKGSILCDYHGRIITAAEGQEIQDTIEDNKCYLCFVKDLCIDAKTFPCECHPDKETLGRKINHSKKNANVKPVHSKMQFPDGTKDIILFKAIKDICIDEEIKFDYGVHRKSYGGEGQDLEWLDD